MIIGNVWSLVRNCRLRLSISLFHWLWLSSSARAGGPGTSTGRPLVHRDRAPPVDDSLGRQDRRRPGRKGRRGGNPRRADGPRILLLSTRAEAGCGVMEYYRLERRRNYFFIVYRSRVALSKWSMLYSCVHVIRIFSQQTCLITKCKMYVCPVTAMVR